MKKILFAAFSLLLLGGCSEQKNTAAPEETPKAAEAEEQIIEEEETSPEVILLEDIQAFKLPETAEDLLQIQPGVLTKDFSYEKETALWPALHTLEGIKEELKENLTVITKQTDDPELLHKALVYYLGNARFPEVVDRIASYEPKFDEPLLPEPYDTTETVDGKEESPPEKALILLDASSSMLLNVGGEQKMEIAKSAVRSFANSIGKTSDVSLYVYGHAGTQNDQDKQLSCTTIDEVYPLQKFSEKAFHEAVEQVEAKGWTPLAGAIQKAREDYPEGDVTLYIVSDGAETCDGDPVAEAKALAGENTNRKVNIIGFQVDQTSENQLKAVAEAGNGEYMRADTLEEMNRTITETWLPSALDIIGVMWSTPKGTFAESTQKFDMSRYAQTVHYAIDVQKGRFMDAIRLMKSEDMIDEQLAEELKKRVEEQRLHLKSVIKDLVEKKNQEIGDEADRIDKKIKDWAERMEELKKKQ